MAPTQHPSKEPPAAAGESRTPSLIGRVVGLVLATVAASASGLTLGWLVESGRLAPGRATAAKRDTPGPERKTALKQVPSVLVSMEGAARPWLRLDLSLVCDRDGAVSDVQAAEIAHDAVAYLRTRAPEKLQGPSGIHMLAEDLHEIARRRASDVVRRVLIRSMVIE